VGDRQRIIAAARRRRVARRRLVPVAQASDIAKLTGGEIGYWRHSATLATEVVLGQPNRAAGAAQLGWIDQATDLVSSGVCSALVTAPVSKAVIAASSARGARCFTGHTEHLARRLGAREVVMAFHGEKLTTALVTTHLPLRAVPERITAKGVATSCFWLADLLFRLGIKRPRIVVAALNPHASEDGMLGDEEKLAIAPGLTRARRRLTKARRGAELIGPIGAETAFRWAVGSECDGVVAMYHDQATVPAKVFGFGKMVNVTLGLPIIRTSVDHGTAYDLAGSAPASDHSMRAAIALAARLAEA